MFIPGDIRQRRIPGLGAVVPKVSLTRPVHSLEWPESPVDVAARAGNLKEKLSGVGWILQLEDLYNSRSEFFHRGPVESCPRFSARRRVSLRDLDAL